MTIPSAQSVPGGYTSRFVVNDHAIHHSTSNSLDNTRANSATETHENASQTNSDHDERSATDVTVSMPKSVDTDELHFSYANKYTNSNNPLNPNEHQMNVQLKDLDAQQESFTDQPKCSISDELSLQTCPNDEDPANENEINNNRAEQLLTEKLTQVDKADAEMNVNQNTKDSRRNNYTQNTSLSISMVTTVLCVSVMCYNIILNLLL